MSDMKRMMIGGLSAMALVGGVVATTSPASAMDRYGYDNGYAAGDSYDNGDHYGRNHYSRQHPDSMAYDDGPVGAAGDVVGGAAAGAGAIVGGTLDTAGGLAAGVAGGPYRDGPYRRHMGPAYYQGGQHVYFQGGQQYVRRGAYLYPVGPAAGMDRRPY